jgi:hypothetical protein
MSTCQWCAELHTLRISLKQPDRQCATFQAQHDLAGVATVVSRPTQRILTPVLLIRICALTLEQAWSCPAVPSLMSYETSLHQWPLALLPCIALKKSKNSWFYFKNLNLLFVIGEGSMAWFFFLTVLEGSSLWTVRRVNFEKRWW